MNIEMKCRTSKLNPEVIKDRYQESVMSTIQQYKEGIHDLRRQNIHEVS
jgi:non-homologous end joining protein Ku